MLLAQANGEEATDSGHFIDQVVDVVTAPEAGDRLADWATTGVEWALLLGLLIVPALLLFGGAIGRRYGMAAGGLIGLVAVWWYRFRSEEIISSGTHAYRVDGETVYCRDALVDAEGQLLECT